MRNIYSHFDEAKVVYGKIVEGWEIPVKDITDLTKFEAIMKEVKTGQRKPQLFDATHPALRSISKQYSDRIMSVRLFNVVYDFAFSFIFKYLRQKDYDECNARFPNPFIDLSPVLDSSQSSK